MAPTLPTLVAQARGLLASVAGNGRSAGGDGSLVARTLATDAAAATSSIISQLGPLAARAVLMARDEGDDNEDPKYKNDPHKGSTNFRSVNNTGVFVLFGLIGCAFVAGGIWFFFWARNGGFYFKENDWDDYKSTVLRRKGPNGTLLSGATPSTILGGGSVYKDYDANTEYTGGLTQVTRQTDDTQSTLTGITGGVSDFVGRARRKARREQKEREKEKKKDRKNRDRSRGHREDGVLVDETAEQEAQEHLRAYRDEKAARVGGINKESEGSQWDGSTNPSHSAVSAGDDLLSHREATPTNTPPSKSRKTKTKTKRRDRDRDREKEAAGSSYHRSYRDTDGEDTETAITGATGTSATTSAAPPPTSNTRKAGGIRKVYSTAQRNTDREQERMRSEARRLADKGRSSTAADETASAGIGIGRRFSYQRAESYQRNSNGNRQTMASIIDEEGDIGMPAGGGRYLTAGPGPQETSGNSRDDARNVPAVSDVDTGVDEDRGTKSYHCVIPGLSSVGTSSEVGSSVSGATTNYQEEKRKRRAADRASRGHRRE